MKKLLVNICRIVVALTFIFSGFVKAIDPLGTQYKITDYLTALNLSEYVPSLITLGTSVALSAIEFCLGVFLLFAIHRRSTSKIVVVFMTVMTAVTVWLWLEDPVTDCGCFGDAIHLSNGETLLKNIILLACSLVVAWQPLLMMRFISKSNQWIVMNYTVIFIVVSSLWCLYSLPTFDFRPYHIGANIPKGMEIPEGATPPQFDQIYIMEKDGEQKEFRLDNYPDSTWTFVDVKTTQISEGYVPPIHDFALELMDTGEDITEQVLADTTYTFLLVSPHLENANDTNFGEIDQIYEYALEHGYPFYCMTASNEEGVARWRDLTGAEYPFCMTDEITLKTIIRSNPGLVLLKNGTIYQKWSHNQLPEINNNTPALEETEYGQLPPDSAPKRIINILLLFVLPLFVLTLADRLWAWSKWLRRKDKKVKTESEAKAEEEVKAEAETKMEGDEKVKEEKETENS